MLLEKKLLEVNTMQIAEPIRDEQKVKEILGYYRNSGEIRNYVLIAVTLHTALRISDVLRLRCEDVYDFGNGRVRDSVTLTEKKTGKSKIIALHETVVEALEIYFSQAKPGEPLIKNISTGKALSRVQAYRLISAAAAEVGISHKVGCHSLRKTFGYHA
jgi:integrase